MHYTISMKVLGQTHMWYTKQKRSNFLKTFQFLWVFEFFEHTKKQNKKSKINKKDRHKPKPKKILITKHVRPKQ